MHVGASKRLRVYERAGNVQERFAAGTTFTSNRPPTICHPSFVPVHTALFIRKTPAHQAAFNPSGHRRCHGYSRPDGGRSENSGQCERHCSTATFHNGSTSEGYQAHMTEKTGQKCSKKKKKKTPVG